MSSSALMASFVMSFSARSSLLVVTSVLLALSTRVAADVEPVMIPFNDSRTVGPDGPWNVISTRAGAPLQFLDFHLVIEPGPTVFVADTSCNDQDQSCIQPQPQLYDTSLWSANRDDLSFTHPEQVTFDDWWAPTARLLNLTGSGKPFAESITLGHDNEPDFFWAGEMYILVADNMTANYPNGANYVPLSTLSLSAETMSVPMTTNASNVGWTVLGDLVAADKVASSSWGLHLGSAAQNVSGALHFGGYDQSRLIEEAGSWGSSDGPELASIGVGTAGGASPFTAETQQRNFLKANGSEVKSLQASPDPSVPYLYLPADTCDALAEVLPVIYNTSLNLYTWQTTSPAYDDLLTSPSYLNFTFAASPSSRSSGATSIRVPLTLLNLTLTAPLVDAPTPYFPCAPSNPSLVAPYRLGRAFLQAAFIGQNNDSPSNDTKFWLAQAPGPKGPTTQVKNFDKESGGLTAYRGAPSWEETWAGVLKPLTSLSSSVNDSSSSSDSNSGDANTGLSVGAKAGVGVGATLATLIVLAGALFALRRHRKARGTPPAPPPKRPGYMGAWPQQIDSKMLPAEMQQPPPSAVVAGDGAAWRDSKKAAELWPGQSGHKARGHDVDAGAPPNYQHVAEVHGDGVGAGVGSPRMVAEMDGDGRSWSRLGRR